MIYFLYFISCLMKCLPRRLRCVLAKILGCFWFSIVRFRRSIVLNNLSLAFKLSPNDPQIAKLARKNFEHYCQTAIEILESLTWSRKTYRQEVAIRGWENVESYLSEGRGGFILTCHLGNWELGVGGLVSKGLPMDIVVKRAGSRMAERLQQWYRRRIGTGVIIETGTAKDILRSVKEGRFVGFMLDQFMGPPIGLPVRFFGQLAGTAAGLALLTEKRDTPIIPGFCYRDNEGKLNVVLESALNFSSLPEDKDERLFVKTQLFNDALESMIRRYPEQWLWLHRRWKPYIGQPRWKPKSLIVAALFAFATHWGGNLLAEEATGIELPPDPSITIPQFKSLPPEELESEGVESSLRPGGPTEKPTLASKSTPSKVNAKKSRSGRKLARERGKPTLSPVATPAGSSKLFDVVLPSKIPFEIGERLEIDLTWTALSAGRAILEVREGPKISGRPTYWLWGNALSSRLVDAIYHVDNTIESFVDEVGMIPYKFLLHMFESKQKKETRVAFDQPEGKAYYWAKRISQRWGNENIDRVDGFTPGTKDMFSALYYARTLDYKLNQVQRFPLYENGQNFEVQLTPVANELIMSKVGAFQCWKILVNVKLNNVLKPTGDMYMWLSDDSKRYIVKFDAKIKIGSLIGSLTNIRERQLSSVREKQ